MDFLKDLEFLDEFWMCIMRYKPGVSSILEMRRVNQFLVALILLSVKFRSYRTSDFKVIIDFVDMQTFISPM